jgi:AraC-like DNA-binding protein
MKILYRQSQLGALDRFGVRKCFFNKLRFLEDYKNVANKSHRHGRCEMHIVTKGHQTYLVNGQTVKVESGRFLLIYPNTPHTSLDFSENGEKYSVTFETDVPMQNGFFCDITPQNALQNVFKIDREYADFKNISATLIENWLLEIIVTTLRLMGINEQKRENPPHDNDVVFLAKQYVTDNVEHSPKVWQLAQYCYISRKQLTRIFEKYEGISPSEYIEKARIERIKELFLNTSLSLKQISEKMSFSSEYYFSAFFKKHTSLPPGEYRKRNL